MEFGWKHWLNDKYKIVYYQVGFFPYECVEIIGDKVPQAVVCGIPETPRNRACKLITGLEQHIFQISFPNTTEWPLEGKREEIFEKSGKCWQWHVSWIELKFIQVHLECNIIILVCSC